MNEWCYEIDEFRSEIDALQRQQFDKRMTEAEQADAWGKLKTMMKHGTEARLRFDGKNPEATVMTRCRFVIELRPKPEPVMAFNRPQRVVRLYYCEPAAAPDRLLALHLGSKANSADRTEQNASIDTAQTRAVDWAA